MFHDRTDKLEIARKFVNGLPNGPALWEACAESAVAINVSIKGSRAIFCVEDSRYPNRIYSVGIFERDMLIWINSQGSITTVKMSPRPYFATGPREGTSVSMDVAIATFVTVLETRSRWDEAADQLIGELTKK